MVFSQVIAPVENDKNFVFIELAGNGYVYSLNYERLLYSKSMLNISAKVGLSYYNSLHNATYVPFSIQAYYGNRSRLEIGIGYTPIFRWDKIKEEGTIFNYDKFKYTENGPEGYIKGHDEPYAAMGFINVGLHQKIKETYFFKIQASPWLFQKAKNYVLVPWGKLSFGKTF